MTKEEAGIIIELMDSEFDSHDFIRLFIQHFPSTYAKILYKHNCVNTAHGEIARFLYTNAYTLKIRLMNKDSGSPNIYNNVSTNARWHKTV